MITPSIFTRARLTCLLLGSLCALAGLSTIAYAWCAAIVAILSGDHGVASLVLTSLQMAVLIGAGIALIWGVDLLFQHAAVLNERIGRSIPGLEKRTQRYLQVLWWGSRVLIVLVVLLSLLQVWGVGIGWLVTSPLGTALLSRLITLLVTAACVVCVVDLSTFISQKLVEPDILAPMEILGVDRFTDSAVVLRARLQTKPLKQWPVGREFNRRMKKLFDARGIKLPFPQRTISWDKPKRGGAVPLQLHLDNLGALAATMGQSDHRNGGTPSRQC